MFFENENSIDNDLINEIGEYLDFKMWSKRDLSKEYDFPGCREDNCLPGDHFMETSIIIYNNIPLLIYKNAGCFYHCKSLYTLNMITLKPTKTSPIQKILKNELIEKIKIKYHYIRLKIKK